MSKSWHGNPHAIAGFSRSPHQLVPLRIVSNFLADWGNLLNRPLLEEPIERIHQG
jgi:hypothetical protein